MVFYETPSDPCSFFSIAEMVFGLPLPPIPRYMLKKFSEGKNGIINIDTLTVKKCVNVCRDEILQNNA